MATLDKAFRVKNGLVVEGTNGTINGSDIITASKITSGTQSGIAVTYADGNVNLNVNDPVITIAGDVDGSATITNLGDTTINVTLDTVNSNVGSFGGQTKIPTFTVNGKGLLTAAGEVDVATNLSIAGDTGTDTVSLLTDTLTVSGGEGIDVAVTNNTITVSAEDASSSNKGVASFDATDFTVTSGAVAVNATTLGTTNLNPGETTSTLAGLQQLDVDNVRIDGNTISSTNTNGNIVIDPSGTGLVDVSNSRITGVAAPVDASDAANKGYVDSVAEGLNVHAAAVAATTANIDLTTGGLLEIDGVQLVAGDRVLVKDQTNKTQNGIYAAAVGAWSRAEDYDAPLEIAGGDFIFVTGGTLYNSTGWVQIDEVGVIGTDPIEWVQFSGAGTYTAGVGIDLNGTEFVLDLSEVSTTDLPEGTNKYYTDERVDDRVAALVSGGTGITASYDDNGNLLTLSTDFTEFSTTDIVEGNKLFFTNQRAVDALQAVVPDFTEIEVNNVARQVAATVSAATAETPVVAYAWAKSEYRTAKFLVKTAYGTHTEVSEVLLTLDTSDNIAVTEYAVVSTNGNAGDITATISASAIQLVVTPVNDNSTVTVYGTLIR